jgi:uncharacterized protein
MKQRLFWPSRFRAHPWARDPHVQTLLGMVLRRRERLPLEREPIATGDGDVVELGWFGSGDGPLVILVHGLGGGFASSYVHAMARSLIARGYSVAALELRGASGEPGSTHRIYHHGDTDDFRLVCRLLARRFPGRPLAAVGWSLGASVVLKALGEEGRRSPLDCAVAVSAPLQLRECSDHLRSGAPRIYQAFMLRCVKRLLRARRVPPELGIDLTAALEARDFDEFGNAYVAPMCGFADADEYCRRVSCGNFVPAIRRPTLVLQARDDPFLGRGALPAGRPNRLARVELSRRGGHVGFVGRSARGWPSSWLERRVSRFLEQRLRRTGRA